MTKIILDISGMHCASCAINIESALKKVPGVISVRVNFATEKAYLEFDPQNLKIDDLIEAVSRAGYRAALPSDSLDREKEAKGLRFRVFSAMALSALLMAVSMPHRPGQGVIYLQFLLATGVLALGFGFFNRGIMAVLKSRRANMDTLIALGVGSAYLYSVFVSLMILSGKQLVQGHGLYYETAAFLLTFILLGKYLEAATKRKTQEAIKKLWDLRPKTALVIQEDEEVQVGVEDLIIGDIILVKPGEKIAVDGYLVEGHSSVDESMVTGESMPVEKVMNSAVIGGTINKSGSFKFRAAKVGSETVLAQIIKLVEEAQGLKAPIQRLADTIAAYFVPAVLGIGIVTFIIWIVLGGGFSFALTAFISVLIIACPCALGLATPTGVMVASGIGARKGILFKGGESLELAGKINTVIFDKTGTLTRGKPCVTEVISVSNFEKNEVLRFAAIAERNSEHPLAEAIVDAARKDNLDVPQPQGFNSLTGMGVIARFGEDIILLGNRKLFNEKNIDPLPIEDKISELEKQSKTVMIAGYKNEIIGIIAVADVLKDFSKEAVEELKERGKEVVMITGDNRQTALAIGGQLGIEKILPEVMPQEKSNEIKKLQQKGLKVAMVGDGINDAPALAQADVGIALGAGTDIAMESAQIVLIKDDLRDVVTAMDLSRTCLRKIKQNLFWAFFYNIIAIPIAAGALYPFTGFLLSPVVAGAAMAFSSVSVVLNSLSMRK